MPTGEPRLWLMRHGQTTWSRSGRHTSVTDLPLTADGESEARRLAPAIAGRTWERVLCSPRHRARRTAELAGLVPDTITEEVAEWDYGELEGLSTPEIRERFADWSIWAGPWPGGETATDVTARADRLIVVLRAGGDGDVAVIGHGHFSRVLAARWVGAEVAVGRWLHLDTATVSELGWDRHLPVIRRWNVAAPADAGAVG